MTFYYTPQDLYIAIGAVLLIIVGIILLGRKRHSDKWKTMIDTIKVRNEMTNKEFEGAVKPYVVPIEEPKQESVCIPPSQHYQIENERLLAQAWALMEKFDLAKYEQLDLNRLHNLNWSLRNDLKITRMNFVRSKMQKRRKAKKPILGSTPTGRTAGAEVAYLDRKAKRKSEKSKK